MTIFSTFVILTDIYTEHKAVSMTVMWQRIYLGSIKTKDAPLRGSDQFGVEPTLYRAMHPYRSASKKPNFG
jgi:hypothetical protein